MENVTNNTATIKQTAKKYFVLTRPDGSEIGATTKASLLRYAKDHGWLVEYIPMPQPKRQGIALFNARGDTAW